MTAALVIAIAIAALALVGWLRAIRREAELERRNHRQRITLGLAYAVARLPRMTLEDFREWALECEADAGTERYHADDEVPA